jgi:GYF domain 2
MSASAANSPPAEWFLARDGQQFGPLSDAELRKLVEFGHLKPTDLLWREGFPDWRPARILLPDETLAAATVAQPVTPSHVAGHVAATPMHPPEPQASLAGQARATVQIEQPQAAIPAPYSGPGPAQTPGGIASSGLQSAQPMAQPPPQAYPQSQPHPQPQPQSQPQRGNPGYAPQAPAARQPVARQPVMTPGQVHAPSGPAAQAAPIAPSASGRRVGSAPVHRPDDDDHDEDDDAYQGSRIGLWLKRVAVFLFFASSLSAAAWYAYPYRDRIVSLAANVLAFGMSGPTSSPITGFQPDTASTDVAFQKAPLWRTLKREFPEWYTERVTEASGMAREQKAEADIGLQMMQAVMALRRKHAGDALSATTPRLKAVAAAFADNLIRLRQVSVTACHGFISAGETSPAYLKLLADTSHSGPLQAQLTAVFDAIAEGRKLPRIYPQPKQADYNLLVTALEARGWTDADMQLFSDSRTFAQASQEKVCQMVTDWFQSQLDLKDADAQLRLLADALKPVVAG